VPHDLTIPYVRNVMGPVSFTPVHLTRSAGTYSYQLGQAVIYEAGIQIFAERHDRILAFEGVELLKAVPSAWDEIKFIDGYPASHAVFARRKGTGWFVGGITAEARTATLPLSFLAEGATYQADIYRDADSRTGLVRESRTLTRKDTLTIAMQAAGGFAIYFKAR
jgi:alpha-glucosidase